MSLWAQSVLGTESSVLGGGIDDATTASGVSCIDFLHLQTRTTKKAKTAGEILAKPTCQQARAVDTLLYRVYGVHG